MVSAVTSVYFLHNLLFDGPKHFFAFVLLKGGVKNGSLRFFLLQISYSNCFRVICRLPKCCLFRYRFMNTVSQDLFHTGICVYQYFLSKSTTFEIM